MMERSGVTLLVTRWINTSPVNKEVGFGIVASPLHRSAAAVFGPPLYCVRISAAAPVAPPFTVLAPAYQTHARGPDCADRPACTTTGCRVPIHRVQQWTAARFPARQNPVPDKKRRQLFDHGYRAGSSGESQEVPLRQVTQVKYTNASP
jgi:hypothetical protein